MPTTAENLKTNINTQFYIYNYLDRYDVLFEFLYRAKLNILSKHINEDIAVNNPFPGHNTITILTGINESNTHATPDIYIIIKFIDKDSEDPEQHFGHITFHLLKNIINPDYGEGALHIVNDRSRRRRQKLRLRKIDPGNTYAGLVFSIGGCKYHRCTVGEPLPQLATSVINVVNRYFNPSDELSLLNKIDPSYTDPKLDSYVRYILNYNTGRRGGGKRQTKRKHTSKTNLSLTRKHK